MSMIPELEAMFYMVLSVYASGRMRRRCDGSKMGYFLLGASTLLST